MKKFNLIIISLLMSSCSLNIKTSSKQSASTSTYESSLSIDSSSTSSSLSTTSSSEFISTSTNYSVSSSDISSTSEITYSTSIDEFANTPLEIYFIDFKSDGDSTLIKYGDIDILIDAGGTGGKASTEYITNFLSEKVEDGIIEYLIVSHNDMDHIASLSGYVSGSGETTVEKYTKGVLGLFQVANFIDNGVERTTQVYKRYSELRNYQIETYGSNYYPCKELFSEEGKNIIEFSNYFNMEFLYTKYLDKPVTNDNNNSVCLRLNFQEKDFLFLGDAEYDCEDELIKKNNMEPCDLFKASHHGSNTANNDILLDVITPKKVVIPCGVTSKYGLPQQGALDRLFKHTDEIYATSICGTISVQTSVDSDILIEGENNSQLLKDSEWFQENRTYITDTNA